MVVCIFATMSKGQKVERIICFPRLWQNIVLTQCRAVGGLLRHLRMAAGLHPRYTKPDAHITLDQFIRIELNKGMLQDHSDFMHDWDILGELLYEFGNEHGDEFNKQHKRKKTKT